MPARPGVAGHTGGALRVAWGQGRQRAFPWANTQRVTGEGQSHRVQGRPERWFCCRGRREPTLREAGSRAEAQTRWGDPFPPSCAHRKQLPSPGPRAGPSRPSGPLHTRSGHTEPLEPHSTRPTTASSPAEPHLSPPPSGAPGGFKAVAQLLSIHSSEQGNRVIPAVPSEDRCPPHPSPAP